MKAQMKRPKNAVQSTPRAPYQISPNGSQRSRSTKIVCTLGPATDAPGVLEALVTSGMDVARINMSHGSHEDHAARIERVRAASRALSKPVALLADLPGPKFRIGSLPDGSVTLTDAMTVYLAGDARSSECLPVRQRELLTALRAGDTVYLADGSVELRVNASTADRVECEVVAGGTVRSGSGINVPDSDLPSLVPTEDDRRHLAFLASRDVDWVGVSFVQFPEELQRVRDCLPGPRRPLLVAKIEKRRALANLEAIVQAADGVMVARGDLGVETDLAEIPLVQKRIIAAANAAGRPVITATQMLESMVEHERPTRAEVTDVANAALDGTDAVMLSAETAVGRHPAGAVRILDRVLAATEAEYGERMAAARLQADTDLPSRDQPIAFAACQLARRVNAGAIVACMANPMVVGAIARYRPAALLVVVSNLPELCSALAMVWGVKPLHTAESDRPAQMRVARTWLRDSARLGSGCAVLVSSSGGAGDTVDTLQVVEI